MGFMNKNEYVIYIVIPQYGKLTIVRVFKTKVMKEWISPIKGRTFFICWDSPIYTFQNKSFYVVDYESGDQLYLNDKRIENPNPKDNDLIVRDELMKQILNSANADKKEQLIYSIIGGIIGLLAGIVIMVFVNQSKIDEIYKQFLDNQPVIIPTMIQTIKLMVGF